MISKDAINEEMEQIRKERSRSKTATNEDCSNSEHCQRLAAENELPTLLSEGWRVVTALPSGKVVLESN